MHKGFVELQGKQVQAGPVILVSPSAPAGRKSANQLTVAAQDPISKIPQYKVCGCRVRPADGPPAYAAVLEPQQ